MKFGKYNFSIANVGAFVQANMRMFIEKHGVEFGGLSRHIQEQIVFRESVANPTCKANSECKCACPIPDLFYADKTCEDECYPRMMNEVDWLNFKTRLVSMGIAEEFPLPKVWKTPSEHFTKVLAVSPRIDLGTLSQGAVVDVAIEFVNSLDVDVVMTGVSSSCGCTVIDKTISIPAKSEAKLNVKLDTSKRKAGAMSVMVTTTWSNGDEVSINLVGTVEAVDVVAPGKFTVYVDAGHGGLDSAGRYTTPASNGKRFTHKSGVFHSGTTFFEGVSNRKSASMLKSKLEAAGFRVVSVYDEVVDTSLVSRTSMANADYTPANRPGMLISLHSNAVAPENAGRARGFCVYTSIGNTTSDTYATFLVEEYRKALPNIQVRTDMSDGDPDYEANFHMLSQSAMPAILPENLFFDNIHDATLLMQDDYHDKYTDALLQTCVRARNLFYGVK